MFSYLFTSFILYKQYMLRNQHQIILLFEQGKNDKLHNSNTHPSSTAELIYVHKKPSKLLLCHNYSKTMNILVSDNICELNSYAEVGSFQQRHFSVSHIL